MILFNNQNRKSILYKALVSVLALTVTVFVIFINKQILGTEVVTVTFDVKTSLPEKTTIKVFYTENETENWHDYTKFVSTSLDTNIEHWSHVKLNIPIKNNNELYKFTLKLSENRGIKPNGENLVLIRRLNIGGQIFNEIPSDEFEVVSNDLEYHGYEKEHDISFFVLRNNGYHPYFTLKNPLKIKPNSIDYNYYYLFIFSLVVFCISYMILRLLFDIKLNNKASLANLSFLVLVIITVFIPSWRINQDENSEQEKRKLAEFKGLFVDNKLNEQFGKNFEDWFNDRFYGRNSTIFVNNYLKLRINNTFQSNYAIKYKDWIYNPYEQELAFNQDLAAKNRNTLEFFAKEFNKKIIVLVYPYTATYYKDINIRKKISQDTDLITNFFNESQYLQAIDVSKIWNESEKIEDDAHLLFYKDEHHATEYADWLIVKNLIDKKIIISENYIEPNSIELNCVYGEIGYDCPKYGQTYGILFSQKQRYEESHFFKTEKYLSYSREKNYMNCVNFNTTSIHWLTKIENKCVFDNNQKIMIIGNSFVENLSKVLASKTKQILRTRVYSGGGILCNYSDWNQIAKDFSPDIIIATFYMYEFKDINK